LSPAKAMKEKKKKMVVVDDEVEHVPPSGDVQVLVYMRWLATLSKEGRRDVAEHFVGMRDVMLAEGHGRPDLVQAVKVLIDMCS